jgi:hypothetical protein
MTTIMALMVTAADLAGADTTREELNKGACPLVYPSLQRETQRRFPKFKT